MNRASKPDELLPTRRSLLSRLKNSDDHKSWQNFFDTYSKLIYGVALKSGLSDDEAKDVLQETVISVMKNIKDFKYDPSRSFKAWLLQATRWRINDQFRKRLPVSRSLSPNNDSSSRTSTVERMPGPSGYDLNAKWDSEWMNYMQQAALQHVRNKVSAEYYQIFDAYAIKNWPTEKVTSTFKVTEAKVFQVKSRVVALLAKEIRRLERTGL